MRNNKSCPYQAYGASGARPDSDGDDAGAHWYGQGWAGRLSCRSLPSMFKCHFCPSQLQKDLHGRPGETESSRWKNENGCSVTTASHLAIAAISPGWLGIGQYFWPARRRCSSGIWCCWVHFARPWPRDGLWREPSQHPSACQHQAGKDQYYHANRDQGQDWTVALREHQRRQW